MKFIKNFVLSLVFATSFFTSLSAYQEQVPDDFLRTCVERERIKIIVNMIEKSEDELILNTLSVQLAIELNLAKYSAYRLIRGYEKNIATAQQYINNPSDYRAAPAPPLFVILSSEMAIKNAYRDLELIETLQDKHCLGLSLDD